MNECPVLLRVLTEFKHPVNQNPVLHLRTSPNRTDVTMEFRRCASAQVTDRRLHSYHLGHVRTLRNAKTERLDFRRLRPRCRS